MVLKVKDKYKDTVIAFNKGGKTPLVKRSQSDLIKLAILALDSGDKQLLDFFETPLPTLKELQRIDFQSTLNT